MKKKWFFVIFFLIIIAVVLAIVFFMLFKEKDTKSLALSLNETVQTGYLADTSEEYETITKYLNNVLTNMNSETGREKEKKEVKNYLNSYKAFQIAGQFFNGQMTFTNFTDGYKQNRKPIQKALESAQKSANEMKTYIDENEQKTSGSSYWTSNSWVNCKVHMQNLYSQTALALEKLSTVYTTSVTSKLMNNGLTEIIFSQMNKSISENEKKIDEIDTLGKSLYNFVNTYLSRAAEEKILGYAYNQDLKTSVKSIKENKEESPYYQNFVQGNLDGFGG